MSEFFFVVKTFIISAVVILLLQIRIGRTTLEEKSLAWLHESSSVEALRGVADGAIALGERGFAGSKKFMDRQYSEIVQSRGDGGAEAKRQREARREKRREAWKKEVESDDSSVDSSGDSGVDDATETD